MHKKIAICILATMVSIGTMLEGVIVEYREWYHEETGTMIRCFAEKNDVSDDKLYTSKQYDLFKSYIETLNNNHNLLIIDYGKNLERVKNTFQKNEFSSFRDYCIRDITKINRQYMKDKLAETETFLTNRLFNSPCAFLLYTREISIDKKNKFLSQQRLSNIFTYINHTIDLLKKAPKNWCNILFKQLWNELINDYENIQRLIIKILKKRSISRRCLIKNAIEIVKKKSIEDFKQLQRCALGLSIGLLEINDHDNESNYLGNIDNLTSIVSALDAGKTNIILINRHDNLNAISKFITDSGFVKTQHIFTKEKIPLFCEVFKKLLYKSLCAFCSNPLAKRLRCNYCRDAMYCNQTCQKIHWKEHRRACKKTSTNTQRKTCSYCQQAYSSKLKVCSRCKKAWYCNQDCQRNHWRKEHKQKCNPKK